ncbi:hypothetical protein E2C01_062801 [Portunus trituberculatus]|uniref:Uncharacterized protein n=1 Tax=Portunus trituberculatus TaxID=210409 RepID=A0A5B7HFW2_PORTR|nr:hypothetical protein [Portunus trituberculatus]
MGSWTADGPCGKPGPSTRLVIEPAGEMTLQHNTPGGGRGKWRRRRKKIGDGSRGSGWGEGKVISSPTARLCLSTIRRGSGHDSPI